MMDFFKAFFENVERMPDAVAVSDAEKSLTYAELDALSGRVLDYLESENVGAEEVVLVKISRSAFHYTCLLGVWKAGAVFAGIETGEPVEREKFIREDLKPRLVLDDALLERIFGESATGSATSGTSGRCRPRNLHDGAFFVYTSGSTGHPKGILHEYGSVELMVPTNVRNASGEKMVEPGHRVAVIASLNYLPAFFLFAWAVSSGASVAVVPYAVSKNPLVMQNYMAEQGITTLFVTPTYIKLFKEFPPCVCRIIVAAEIIRDLYLENVELYAMYGMSETGSMPTAFKIDRSYENTPIGKPYGGMEVDVCEGELRVKNPYVRCYVNMPAESAETFRGGWIYTGDMARELPDGNLVIIGRKNDMVKIDGNRVEPGEIESALRRVLGLSWVCVKVFKDASGKATICAYYTDDVDIDYESVFAGLSRFLPHYMLPNHFVHLDSVPRNSNGKLDKLALQCPAEEASHAPYSAPETDVEKRLCAAFKTVLDVAYVGADDDFFALGGSSITTMEAIVASGMAGLEMSDVYSGRTPRKITALWQKRKLSDPAEKSVASPAAGVYPLLPTQQYIWNFQQRAVDSTMYNIYALFALKESVDLERLGSALSQVVLSHRALLTRFEKTAKGEIVQRIGDVKIVDVAIPVEQISEAEFVKLKDALVCPFDLLKDRLFRIRIFKTEKGSFLFTDFHHIVFDGTSIHAFLRDVERLYAGGKPEDDGYEEILSKRLDLPSSTEFRAALERFDALFGTGTWDCCPRTDFESSDLSEDIMISELDLERTRLESFCAQVKIGLSAFFIAVTLKAMARYNQARNVLINWIYRDRDDVRESRAVGALYSSLPVGADASLGDLDFLREVHRQVQQNIADPTCQYTLYRNQNRPHDSLCVLYQGNIRNASGGSSLIKRRLEIKRPKAKNQSIFDLEILDARDRFALMFDYDSDRYNRASIKSFMALWKSQARKFVENTTSDV